MDEEPFREEKVKEVSDVIIYGLVDPRYPNTIKYVGATRQCLENRLSQHVTASLCNQDSKKERWVFSLLEKGVTPNIVEIERATEKTRVDP